MALPSVVLLGDTLHFEWDNVAFITYYDSEIDVSASMISIAHIILRLGDVSNGIGNSCVGPTVAGVVMRCYPLLSRCHADQVKDTGK